MAEIQDGGRNLAKMAKIIIWLVLREYPGLQSVEYSNRESLKPVDARKID